MVEFTIEESFKSDYGIDFIRVKTNETRWKDAPAFVLHQELFENAKRIRNMEIYPDDVWFLCYPKTGSTWAQEMVWLLNNNLDYETANKELQALRFPMFK